MKFNKGYPGIVKTAFLSAFIVAGFVGASHAGQIIVDSNSTVPVGEGPGYDNYTVTVNRGVTLSTGPKSAISLGNNAKVTIYGAVVNESTANEQGNYPYNTMEPLEEPILWMSARIRRSPSPTAAFSKRWRKPPPIPRRTTQWASEAD